MPPTLTIAAGLACLVAAGGWWARSLTGPGAFAAAIIGTTVVAGTGWPGAAALGAFFLLSSALPRLVPAAGPGALDAKGERRDLRQVLANGGAAAAASLVAPYSPGAAIWMVTSSLAAAAADTWATTIGMASGRPARLLLFGPIVPPGTNGGMTLQGCLGAVGGAASVALASVLVSRDWPLLLAGTTVGILGMVLDSILGATLQGTPTGHTGGRAWLNNDGVNAATTIAGALAGAGAWTLLHQ